MNDQDLEKRLARLRLARPSGDYVSRGQSLLHTMKPLPTGGRDRLMPALALALVLSVTINVFQLVKSESAASLATDQPAQCQTPIAAMATGNELELVSIPKKPEAFGIC